MAKRILIVGVDRQFVCALATARRLGMYTVAMDPDYDDPALSGAHESVAGNILSAVAILQAAKTHHVDGIYPTAERAIEPVAEATAELGLPGPAIDTARHLRRKDLLLRSLAAQGVPCPAYHVASELDEAEAAACDFGFPLVVKPADCSGPHAVERVDHFEDVPLAFKQAWKRSPNGAVLIEEAVEGEPYAVDGIVHEGGWFSVGISGKETGDSPHRVDLGLFMPPPLSDGRREQIIETAGKAARAIGYGNGAIHVEVIFTKNGPRIVDVAHPCHSGCSPVDLQRHSSGVDLLADTLRLVVGGLPCERPTHDRAVALFWITSHSGVVEKVAGASQAAQLPGVETVAIRVKPGDRLGHIVDHRSRDRVGWVLASGGNLDEALTNARRARDTIRIVTRPTR